jgi:hypothetical protein
LFLGLQPAMSCGGIHVLPQIGRKVLRDWRECVDQRHGCAGLRIERHFQYCDANGLIGALLCHIGCQIGDIVNFHDGYSTVIFDLSVSA